MTTATDYPHLTVDADGVARIGETRYKVLHLAAEHYQHGGPPRRFSGSTPTCDPSRSTPR